MALDAVSLMRARVRGTPSWPGHDPETGYVGADRSDHSQKLLADGAGRCGSPAAAVSDVCGRWTRDGLTVDPAPWNPGLKYGARRRKSYEGQGARNSILAGARPRDRIRWRRPVRSLAKAACGRGGPYVFKEACMGA